MSAILTIHDFSLSLGTSEMKTPVLKNISLDIPRGKISALVGRSGSGKSQLALSILGLNKSIPGYQSTGKMLFEDNGKKHQLTILPEKPMRQIRNQKIAYIFQQSTNVFNPSQKIGEQIAEGALLHNKSQKTKIKTRVIKLLSECGLTPAERFARSYPHQLSGGQIQRALIALALVNEPKLIIADEPTSALDSHLKESIIQLLEEINQRTKTTILIISHDLNLVGRVANYINVIDRGKIIESGHKEQLLQKPQNKLTREMLETQLLFKNKKAEHNLISKEPEHLPVIKITDLTKSYASGNDVFKTNKKDILAVDNVSANLSKGEILGICGPSGSGKSTLARVLALMEGFDSGLYELEGRDIKSLTFEAYASAKAQIQMIFQDPLSALPPHMTVSQVLSEVIKNTGNNQDAIAEALSNVDLSTEYLSRLPRMLSGGERQRILIARALLTKPKLLICDEILSALDVMTQFNIVRLLKKLNQQLGLSIIFISHDRKVAEYISDHILEL